MQKLPEMIDPSSSIKSVRKNILLLSLINLTSSKVILALQSTGNNLNTPPFDTLPLKSIFTFWFSFIFIHHNIALTTLLLGSLFILICRSSFDFFFYEQQFMTTRWDIRKKFTIFTQLEYAIFTYLDEQLDKNPWSYRFIYFPNRTITSHRLTHYFSFAAYWMPTEELKATCNVFAAKTAKDYGKDAFNAKDMEQELLNFVSNLQHELRSLTPKAYLEFYGSCIHNLIIFTPILIGAFTFCYCLLQIIYSALQ